MDTLGNRTENNKIYIPIWLDLLLESTSKSNREFRIYIPIWLDLLCRNPETQELDFINLHSNMVRFIICFSYDTEIFTKEFTFQYG